MRKVRTYVYGEIEESEEIVLIERAIGGRSHPLLLYSTTISAKLEDSRVAADSIGGDGDWATVTKGSIGYQ